MSWQKCPVCNGEGTICIPISYAGTNPVCPTCKGARIISELTGLPPVYAAPDPLKIDLPPFSDEDLKNLNKILGIDENP